VYFVHLYAIPTHQPESLCYIEYLADTYMACINRARLRDLSTGYLSVSAIARATV
jgi:hypothetical protein